ncbi:MAG: ThuA domain-containing protein [Ignavibacteriae bacterium]|nr:ThuA domain-containing protein [Ignavibacteriota bacterium]MCB9206390.1 ThuA domain-containing protein [Ignavibacteriales bacterium]MCB9208767.1 ThuA domain-containing protein [Ignavibacteriales bacterium]MCB9218315.1 ThuA domain-containing protein [Ignavibacteriales bacterium]MCB9260611.1 ThuA domain-containing protein [Ignavibacteriales bacterium]
MKLLTNHLLLLISVLLFVFTSVFAISNPNQQKKVLLVYGGWEGHQPKEFKDLILPWLQEQGFDVTVSNSLEIYADSAKMTEFDLIVQTWTMGQLTGEQEKGLTNAVKNGVGIAGYHGGLGDAFRSNTNYLFMVGGQFTAHPGGQIDFTVNIKNHDDPITKGIADFTVHSEQYYMLVDPAVEVLATTTFSGEHADWVEGVVMPVVWKKNFGKGKVFYSSVGHSMKDFETPEVLEILKRGILWAVK